MSNSDWSCQQGLGLSAARAVQVPEDVRPLQKPAFVNHRFEGTPIHKIIVDSVNLAGSRRT